MVHQLANNNSYLHSGKVVDLHSTQVCLNIPTIQAHLHITDINKLHKHVPINI